jgi:hypothetical protein
MPAIIPAAFHDSCNRLIQRLLFSYSQLDDDGAISIHILIFEIVKKAAPFSNHPKKTSAGMVVFGMRFEMLRQVDDFIA